MRVLSLILCTLALLLGGTARESRTHTPHIAGIDLIERARLGEVVSPHVQVPGSHISGVPADLYLMQHIVDPARSVDIVQRVLPWNSSSWSHRNVRPFRCPTDAASYAFRRKPYWF
jgi:hypothetical protein